MSTPTSRTHILVNPQDASGNTPFSVLNITEPGTGVRDTEGEGGIGDYLVVGDIDCDGFSDLSFRKSNLVDLYLNDGDGTFTGNSSIDVSVDGSGKGGNLLCDFDNDGDLDLFFSDGATDQTGNGYVANSIILWDASNSTYGNPVTLPLPGGANLTGGDCGDVDNDGDLDLFIANDGNDRILLNQLADSGTLGLVRAPNDFGMSGGGASEGALFVDYDKDGDLDLYINTSEGNGNRLWRNDHANDTNNATANSHLTVDVARDLGSCADPDSIGQTENYGAKVFLKDLAGHVLAVRDVNLGQGHGAQGHAQLHFGLGAGGEDTAYLVEILPLLRGGVSPAEARWTLQVIRSSPHSSQIRPSW
ncbi:MAG: hypothetical protein ACI9MR_002940 [Myxococcota bacterium]